MSEEEFVEHRQVDGPLPFRALSEAEIKGLAPEQLQHYATEATAKLAVITRLNSELKDLSLHDSLTHTLNREGLMGEIKSRMAKDKNFVLVFIDLGDFKMVNDNLSHVDGDRFLQEFSEVLMESAQRDTDIVARYGGDEFVLVLGESNIRASRKVMDRIKRAYERRKESVSEEQKSLKQAFVIVKPDIGYAVWDRSSSQTIEEVLKVADERMYKEKQSRQASQGKYR